MFSGLFEAKVLDLLRGSYKNVLTKNGPMFPGNADPAPERARDPE